MLAPVCKGPCIGVLAAAALALVPAPSLAQGGGDRCLTADPPPVTRPSVPLRFGITPQAAGSVGTGQASVAPEDPAAAVRALQELRPEGRELVLRLNRLFWADGSEGIARFAERVDAYARAGLRSEIQVRYHPPEGAEGDLDAWERFVRAAVRELGRRPSVVAFSITNEANFPGSRNTSDGAYAGVVGALVRGVAVAGEELAALGRPDVQVGFSMMWRWSPDSDARFWEDVGAAATPAFRRALDYVGLQVYPGLVWPPAPLPGRSAGDEVVEALTLLRSCYLPKAGLGPEIALWVSENGYATNLGRTEATQEEALRATVEAVARRSGELGVSDYRYFNLRDNDSDGTDLFAAVGLLRDDYARKPAFAALRELIAAHGAPPRDAGPATGPPGARPRAGRRRSRLTLRVRGGVARGRVVAPRGTPCRGRITLRAAGRTRAARVRRSCRFRVRLPGVRRGTRVRARFAGTALLRPARARARAR
jgi:hypothetical protein